MANRYDTNLILDRIADALNDDQNSALIDALTTIANAISQSGGGDIPSGGTMGQLLGKRSNQDFDLTWYDNLGDDALSNQASEYNPQSNYVVGDYCLHTNYLYVCTSPTTGNWDSTCWNRVQFGGEISALNSNIRKVAPISNSDSVIDISGYNTTSNYYECPCDGYARVEAAGDTIQIISTSDGNGINLLRASGVYISIFVKKGSRILAASSGGSSGNTHRFIKLESTYS